MKKLGGLCRQCAVSNCWDLSKFKAALWHRSILGRLVETTVKWAVSFCTSTGVESERRSRTHGNHFDPSDKPFTKKQYWTVFAWWPRQHFAHCDRIWLHLNLDWDPHSSFASCGINKGRLPSFGSMHLVIAMKCYESMIGHKSISRTHTKNSFVGTVKKSPVQKWFDRLWNTRSSKGALAQKDHQTRDSHMYCLRTRRRQTRNLASDLEIQKRTETRGCRYCRCIIYPVLVLETFGSFGWYDTNPWLRPSFGRFGSADCFGAQGAQGGFLWSQDDTNRPETRGRVKRMTVKASEITRSCWNSFSRSGLKGFFEFFLHSWCILRERVHCRSLLIICLKLFGCHYAVCAIGWDRQILQNSTCFQTACFHRRSQK